MKINSEVIAFWKKYYEHGDYVKLSVATRLDRLTIINAFKYERGSSTTLIAITNYYLEKEKKINNLTIKINENETNDGN